MFEGVTVTEVIVAAVALLGVTGTLCVVLLRLGEWRGRVDADRESFKKSRDKTDERFEQIMNRIDENFGKLMTKFGTIALYLPGSSTGGASPRKLTDFGKQIAKQANTTKWAREEAHNLVKRTTGKEEFEIFNMCVDHVKKAFSSNIQLNKRVQSVAYQLTTDIDNVLNVYNVELRDAVLKLRKKS